MKRLRLNPDDDYTIALIILVTYVALVMLVLGSLR